MIVESNQIFNLMDTNGRRSDVLNALKIYLEILEELKEVYPTESWGTYPDSLSQFLFYEKALEKQLFENGITIIGYTESAQENGFYRLKKLGITQYFKNIYTSESKYISDIPLDKK